MGSVTAVPRPGMLATVRNRRGVVAAVEPHDGEAGAGRIHLVHLEYTDHQSPREERLLWEIEGAPSDGEGAPSLLEPNALPDPAHQPMAAPDFDAMLRAARWTALSPYLDPSGEGRPSHEPLASPFHGGVRIENYQLVPLLKALRMPRVNLLIADDVGLGKTVEAGLVLSELLLRRRIRRALVLTPASLRRQWSEEMWEKFSLRFEIVDRLSTEKLRRRQGMDANPWRSFSRVVASYHYLRQPDVLEQFRAACDNQSREGSPHLPWDLLIVDECHNLMPSPFGEDSELCKMLREVAPRFEHRLFLSATPHNGHTRSFTGLLEMLDPVRFSRTGDMNPAMRRRIGDVVIRRLKREINAVSIGEGTGPRFCTRRPPKALALDFGPQETGLSAAFDDFRRAVHGSVAEGGSRRRRAGAFAVEIFGKRLLSCPTAFAESWSRAKQGFEDPEAAGDKQLATAERSVRQDTGDDREAQQRQATASTVVGAWLKNFAGDLKAEILGIEDALAGLDFDLGAGAAPVVSQTPIADARFDRLLVLVGDCLRTEDGVGADGRFRSEGRFHSDERLVVFTEYKTTLDYVARRLRERYGDERVLTLFGAGGPGGLDESGREQVKAAFNDPVSAVRILVATDAASEGLNLHRTARYLLHWDCPWNPSRLEQRNGRLDRYGQARDVTVHHFVSDTDPDLRFLDHVVRKADDIREDLGSVNEVFDRAVHRRLVRGEDAADVQAGLDLAVEKARGRASFRGDRAATWTGNGTSDGTTSGTSNGTSDGTSNGENRDISPDILAAEIDFDPDALRDTLEAAMAETAGRPQLRPDSLGCPAGGDSNGRNGFHRIVSPDLSGWAQVVDDSVRRPGPGGVQGPVPALAFSPEPFIEKRGDLSVFRPRKEALLVHLAHPIMRHALDVLAKQRYTGAGADASRWTVRCGGVPDGASAAVLLSVEEIGVNQLRETFHRWVRTVVFPVQDGELGPARPHVPARSLRSASECVDEAHMEQAREILEAVGPALKKWVRDHRLRLGVRLVAQLEADGVATRARERKSYEQRVGEVSALITRNTMDRLGREIERLKGQREQGLLFDEAESLADLDRSIAEREGEIERRRSHHNEIREQLQRERERVVNRLLPKRFALAERGTQLFPVAVEVRLPW